ncbi:F-box only protein 47-like [Halichoeres trimaculatus]|uniref:F-box only protein 47-like n=1 Tax=Halichoeres trimaculatus TaxID=147232 RepID=UPI003D9DE896
MTRRTSRKVFTPKSQHHKNSHFRRCPPRTIVTRSRHNTTASFFHRLPSEVFDMILDKLSVLELSVFSMVSKDMTRYILDYISTAAWKNKMIIQNFHYSTSLERKSSIRHYRDLGLLFKRCTLLVPTNERLKLIFNKFSEVPCLMLEQCLAQFCTGFSCYGVFLQTLIAGWDELECHRVFKFLCENTNLLQKIVLAINEKPGVRWYQELQLRLFCRQVLLDPWPNQPDCQFWLMQLLKPWPLFSQAHLLFILYGPLLPEGPLGWQVLVEGGVPHTRLWDLARAILLLSGSKDSKGQTQTSVLAILEELTAIPQPWHEENVARLLVLCGSSLCYTVLASKAVSGRLLEISRLLVNIVLVCEKDGYHMSWVVQLVLQILKVFSTPQEKFRFIQQLEDMFSVVMREFYEFSVAGNHLDDQASQSLCILMDSSSRFHTKFLHMLLK